MRDSARRSGDVARLIVGALGVVCAGLWAQASTSLDTNLFDVVNELPDSLEGLANAFDALGSIWFIAAIVLVLLVARRFYAARDAALAGAGAWVIALGLNELIGARSASDLGSSVGTWRAISCIPSCSGCARWRSGRTLRAPAR